MKVNGHECTREELKKAMLVYAITDRYWLKPGEELVDKVRESLEGGAGIMQLREKTLPIEEIEKEAIAMKALCAEYDVPFIMNDEVMLAVKLDLDGVHVGQHDMEAGKVRELIGPDKILGVSAQTVEEAILAEKLGADYLGVGAVFPTGSKDDADDVSHEMLQAICEAVSIPVVAIGGITKDNIIDLKGRGIDGISVISAIFAQPDIKEATIELRKRTLEMLESK